VFDSITPDLEYGPVAASAEIIAVASDCLDSFPNLVQTTISTSLIPSVSRILSLFKTKHDADRRKSGRDCIES
jgi:hypothetical protein